MRILSLSLFLTLFVGLSSFTSVQEESIIEDHPGLGTWEVRDVTGVTFCENGFAFSGTLHFTPLYGEPVSRRFTVDCDGNITWETPGFDHLGLSDAEMESILLPLIAEMEF